MAEEHSHKSRAVNWFLKNFSIDFPCQSSFRLFFFFFLGGGAVKSVGKDRENGQVWQDFPYDLKKSFLRCNIDRIYLQLINTCFDSRPSHSSFKSSAC